VSSFDFIPEIAGTWGAVVQVESKERSVSQSRFGKIATSFLIFKYSRLFWRENSLFFGVFHALGDFFTHRFCQRGFFLILLGAVLCGIAPAKEPKWDAWKIDDMEISSDAIVILLQKTQEAITTVADASKKITDETQRKSHIIGFLDTWKNEVIRTGRYYDEAIKDGQDQMVSGSGRFVTSSRPGFRDGNNLAKKWSRNIFDEANSKYEELFYPDQKITPRSRKEIIQAHPHIEALVYLSRVLSHIEIAPSDWRKILAEFERLKAKDVTDGERRGEARGKVIGILQIKFNKVPEEIEKAIWSMTDQSVLESLVTHAAHCKTLAEFSEALQ